MLLLLQNVLYCLLYASLIKCAVRNDGRNCLYFYPKEYIEEAQKREIADKETVMKRSKWFMIPFCIIIFVALILIISVWNHVMDFKTAYLQACLFLVVMNWFDGIVIDRLWESFFLSSSFRLRPHQVFRHHHCRSHGHTPL